MFYIKSRGRKINLRNDNVFTRCPVCGREHAVAIVDTFRGQLRGSVRYKRLLPGVRGKPCPGDEGRKIRKPPRWAAVLRWGVQMVNLVYHRRANFASVINTGRKNQRHCSKRSERRHRHSGSLAGVPEACHADGETLAQSLQRKPGRCSGRSRAGGLSGAHEGGGNLESGQRRVFHMAHVPTENSFCGSVFYSY